MVKVCIPFPCHCSNAGSAPAAGILSLLPALRNRVGADLPVVRLLGILQSQLQWGTYTGCSTDKQNASGITSTVANAEVMNWRSLLLNT